MEEARKGLVRTLKRDSNLNPVRLAWRYGKYFVSSLANFGASAYLFYSALKLPDTDSPESVGYCFAFSGTLVLGGVLFGHLKEEIKNTSYRRKRLDNELSALADYEMHVHHVIEHSDVAIAKTNLLFSNFSRGLPISLSLDSRLSDLKRVDPRKLSATIDYLLTDPNHYRNRDAWNHFFYPPPRTDEERQLKLFPSGFKEEVTIRDI